MRPASGSGPHPLHEGDSLLLAALARAPRRYRLPPLPCTRADAAAAGPATALAFCIEAVRRAVADAAPPPSPDVAALFQHSLAALVREALQPQRGDPVFQARLLQAQDPAVAEYVRLARDAAADRRAVRSGVDALAHPGKQRGMAAGPLREALSRLHALAEQGDWAGLMQATQALQAQPLAPQHLHGALAALQSRPALARLARTHELLAQAGVRRYLDLRSRHGPTAGSDDAAAAGRASARHGVRAEQATVQAFALAAGLLAGQATGAHWRVLRSLRPLPGFPGATVQAKDEWDVALARGAPGGAWALVLVAEVKASPAAASSDFPRLLRGLQRLGQAEVAADYRFASAEGEVLLQGAALRRLAPQGRALPPQVIYCSTAPVEPRPSLLGAATRAVLLAEPASLAFALQLAAGADPREGDLEPVWQALATQARLRAALHQDHTARAAREAMLHPQDLVAVLAQSERIRSP